MTGTQGRRGKRRAQGKRAGEVPLNTVAPPGPCHFFMALWGAGGDLILIEKNKGSWGWEVTQDGSEERTRGFATRLPRFTFSLCRVRTSPK